MLWLTPVLLAPNSSEVIDTAAEITNPELIPTMPIPACNATSLLEVDSNKKANGVGTKESANQPVLAK